MLSVTSQSRRPEEQYLKLAPKTALQSLSTPLYSAANNGHKEAVAALIAAKADIEIKNKVWREQVGDIHRLFKAETICFHAL